MISWPSTWRMRFSPERSPRDLRETPEEHAMKLLDRRAMANGSRLFVGVLELTGLE